MSVPKLHLCKVLFPGWGCMWLCWVFGCVWLCGWSLSRLCPTLVVFGCRYTCVLLYLRLGGIVTKGCTVCVEFDSGEGLGTVDSWAGM